MLIIPACTHQFPLKLKNHPFVNINSHSDLLFETGFYCQSVSHYVAKATLNPCSFYLSSGLGLENGVTIPDFTFAIGNNTLEGFLQLVIFHSNREQSTFTSNVFSSPWLPMTKQTRALLLSFMHCCFCLHQHLARLLFENPV